MMNRKSINYEKLSQIIFVLLAGLNFFIIEFLSLFMYSTYKKIIGTQQVSSFIQMTGTIPSFSMKQGLLYVNLFFVLLLILFLFYCRREWNPKIKNSIYIFSLICCAFIMYYLQFSTNSIVLFFIAFLLHKNQESNSRFIFLILAIFLYMISNHTILSFFNPIPFEQFVSLYASKSRIVLTLIKNILDTLNSTLFILFMFIIMLGELNENKRIKILNEELQNLNQQLEEYARLQEKMGETKERNRLAREIHDTLGHTLTGLSVGIDAARVMMDFDQESTKKQLSLLSDAARQGLKDVRRSVEKLRPDALERYSLKEAIDRLILDFEKVSKVNIKFIYHIGQVSFQKDLDEVIYRIVQESLTNSIRHGKANNIYVSFAYEDNQTKLVIIIEDDGIGCQNIKEGFGLHHMKERISTVNGRLRIYGYDGFIIIAEIPLRIGEIS